VRREVPQILLSRCIQGFGDLLDRVEFRRLRLILHFHHRLFPVPPGRHELGGDDLLFRSPLRFQIGEVRQKRKPAAAYALEFRPCITSAARWLLTAAPHDDRHGARATPPASLLCRRIECTGEPEVAQTARAKADRAPWPGASREPQRRRFHRPRRHLDSGPWPRRGDQAAGRRMGRRYRARTDYVRAISSIAGPGGFGTPSRLTGPA
jgi:hypothetical protein